MRRAVPDGMLNPAARRRASTPRAARRGCARIGAERDRRSRSAAALGALLWYLGETHRASIDHLRAPRGDGSGGAAAASTRRRAAISSCSPPRAASGAARCWGCSTRRSDADGRPPAAAVAAGAAHRHRRRSARASTPSRTAARSHSWRQAWPSRLGTHRRSRAPHRPPRGGARDAARPGRARGRAGRGRRRARRAGRRRRPPPCATAARRPRPICRACASASALTLADDPPLNPRAGGLIRAGLRRRRRRAARAGAAAANASSPSSRRRERAAHRHRLAQGALQPGVRLLHRGHQAEPASGAGGLPAQADDRQRRALRHARSSRSTKRKVLGAEERLAARWSASCSTTLVRRRRRGARGAVAHRRGAGAHRRLRAGWRWSPSGTATAGRS